MYAFLADVVVALHVLYVAYVILGQMVIIVAGTARWEWGRNPWFRFSHLAAILIVAYEEFAGIRCPLTVWEENLRLRAGQEIAQGSFLGRFLHDVLFINGFSADSFAVMHVACAILVVQAALMYPPRLWSNRSIAVTPHQDTKI